MGVGVGVGVGVVMVVVVVVVGVVEARRLREVPAAFYSDWRDRMSPTHPGTEWELADTLNSLGALSQKQEKYDAAAALYARSLELRRSRAVPQGDDEQARPRPVGPALALTQTPTPTLALTKPLPLPLTITVTLAPTRREPSSRAWRRVSSPSATSRSNEVTLQSPDPNPNPNPEP